MYGIHVEYNYQQGHHNAPSDGVIAAYETREEALKCMARLRRSHLYFDADGACSGIYLQHGEWAMPKYKIVGVRNISNIGPLRPRLWRGTNEYI